MGTYRASPTCATGLPYSNAAVASLQPGEMPARCSRCSAPSGTFSTPAPQLAQPRGQYHCYPMDVHEHSTGIHRHQFQVCPAPHSQHHSPDLGFFSFACATAWVLLPHHSWPQLCLCPHAGGILVTCQACHSITQVPTLASSSPPAPLASPQDKKDEPRQQLRTQISLREIQAAGMGAVGRTTSRLSLGTAGFGACRKQGLDEGALCQAPSSAALISRGIPLSSAPHPRPALFSGFAGGFPIHPPPCAGGRRGAWHRGFILKGDSFPRECFEEGA